MKGTAEYNYPEEGGQKNSKEQKAASATFKIFS